MRVYVSMCVFSDPSQPDEPLYLTSTESTITLAWKQSGYVDNYTIQYNNTNASSVNFTGVGSGNVSATVSGLPTPGAYYCITVTARSRNLYSDATLLCNFIGKLLTLVYLSSYVIFGVEVMVISCIASVTCCHCQSVR